MNNHRGIVSQASSRVVIHVGYGKTGTTWLQERIFSRLPSGIYLGKRKNDFPRWLIEINYLDELCYAEKKEAIHAALSERLAGKKLAVISSEAFTNLGAIYQQSCRIKELFHHPYIILVLRNPIDWLISNYKYCVEFEGFFRHFEDYLDFGEDRTPFALEKRPPFYIPDFYYNEIVAHYRRWFGYDRVLVQKYEDFQEDPGAFGDRLSALLGVNLPRFREQAAYKVLASKPDDVIEELRMRNFYRLAYRVLEQTSSQSMMASMPSPRCRRPMMLPKTRDALVKSLAPRCSDFYPDLQTPSP